MPSLVTESKPGLQPGIPWGCAIFGYTVAFLYGAAVTIRLLRGSGSVVADAAIAFMWLTLTYAAIVVNLTDIWENNRIRFMTDPLMWIVVGAAVTSLARKLFLMGAHQATRT